MDQREKDAFIQALENQFSAGYSVTFADIARAKLELEIADAQVRSAVASEKNARYVLWSVIAAAVSALAALASTLIAVVWHS